MTAPDWDPSYERRCQILSAYDGDTLTLLVELAYKVRVQVRVRLENIDTPELRGVEKVEGRKALAALLEWAAAVEGEWPFVTRSAKTGKYGRWLSDLRHVDSDEWLTDHLKALGFDTEDWIAWL